MPRQDYPFILSAQYFVFINNPMVMLGVTFMPTTKVIGEVAKFERG
jgi:hypothetical protein